MNFKLLNLYRCLLCNAKQNENIWQCANTGPYLGQLNMASSHCMSLFIAKGISTLLDRLLIKIVQKLRANPPYGTTTPQYLLEIPKSK